MLASDSQRTCSRAPLAQPQFPSESGCKSTTFSHSRNDFFQKYFIKSHMLLIVKKKNLEYNNTTTKSLILAQDER